LRPGLPNATTRKAIAQLEAGKGNHYESVAAMMTHLQARADD